MRRRCIGHGRVDCPRCRRRDGWSLKRDKRARDAMYTTAEYKTNRRLALEREPDCHWRLPGCTGRSTTADHLIAPFQGGTNELANLVGACRHCNEARGRALGHQVAKANRERKRRGR